MSDVRHFLTVNGNAALLDGSSSLGTGCYKSGFYKKADQVDIAFFVKILCCKLSGRHMLCISSACKKCLGTSLCLLRFFCSMNKLGKLECKDLFCLVQLAAFPFLHLLDFFQRKEGKKLHAFDNICVVHISPVLVEIEWRCLIWIQPDSTRLCFTHFLTF